MLINFFFIFSYVEEYEEDFWPLFGLLWPLLNTTGIIGRYTENQRKLFKNKYADGSIIFSTFSCSLELEVAFAWPLCGLNDILVIFKGF